MPIDRFELIDRFGRAVLDGNGALFVGAGMSAGAGLPSWGALLGAVQRRAGIPDHHDYPLVAEYIAAEPTIGRGALDQHLLEQITPDGLAPGPEQFLIAQLPVGQVWTTNYDQLLELACPTASLVVNDDDVHALGSSARAIVKMHGSALAGPPRTWASKPVVTRTDYETYSDERPRTWALLRASYLSRTFLFLGFSFTDPNIEIMLQLARRHGTAVGDRHLAVLRRPDLSATDELRLHNLRVLDLERSGVGVHEISDFTELTPLLRALIRRTRPSRLFVAGSSTTAKSDIEPWCSLLATQIAGRTSWEITSMGGPAGWLVTRDAAQIRRAEGTYDPTKLLFYFRAKDEPAPPMESRIGSAIYTDRRREDLVPLMLDDCRTLVAVAGGNRTQEEIEWASGRGVGVVPLARTGGAALGYWESCKTDPPDLGGRPVTRADWALLADDQMSVAVRAAVRLIEQSMYWTSGDTP